MKIDGKAFAKQDSGKPSCVRVCVVVGGQAYQHEALLPMLSSKVAALIAKVNSAGEINPAHWEAFTPRVVGAQLTGGARGSTGESWESERN